MYALHQVIGPMRCAGL